jgi:hypothetical protein
MTTEQVKGVISAEVDTTSCRIIRKGLLGAETSAGPSKPINVIWKASGQGYLIGKYPKTLTERFNEVHDEDAEREDAEFLAQLKHYHSRRFSDEW